MAPSEKPAEPVELSIGTLSSATGVPVDTLRTWERRYGFPAPSTRTGGSHRRYAADTIGQVQLIVRALELGHRPSAVVGRDPDELRRLVGVARAPAAPSSAWASGSDTRAVARWLELTHALDGDGLTGEFHRSLAEMAAIPLLERRVGPYLREVGEEWSRGLLRVSQEHYASERVREFLSAQWRQANDGLRAGQVSVVLATLSGEQHVLGLHMAAWVIALAGVHVVFLGADTPLGEVVYAVERHAARGVAMSVAAGYAGDLEAALATLRATLPRETRLVLGGAGAAGAPVSAPILNRLEDLFDWAASLVEPAARSAKNQPNGH
ncbi:MAG TPA: MerR family transcriptional regulator [Polyangiaceae bacterium]|nr:MerR family transcriptional regulator [Polyangiaceae bacterium]